MILECFCGDHRASQILATLIAIDQGCRVELNNDSPPGGVFYHDDGSRFQGLNTPLELWQLVKGPVDRKVIEWLLFCEERLDNAVFCIYAPHLGFDANYWPTVEEDLKKSLSILDFEVSNKNFLVGNTISLADIIITTTLLAPFKAIYDILYAIDYPNLTYYLERMSIRLKLGKLPSGFRKLNVSRLELINLEKASSEFQFREDDNLFNIGGDYKSIASLSPITQRYMTPNKYTEPSNMESHVSALQTELENVKLRLQTLELRSGEKDQSPVSFESPSRPQKNKESEQGDIQILAHNTDIPLKCFRSIEMELLNILYMKKHSTSAALTMENIRNYYDRDLRFNIYKISPLGAIADSWRVEDISSKMGKIRENMIFGKIQKSGDRFYLTEGIFYTNSLKASEIDRSVFTLERLSLGDQEQIEFVCEILERIMRNREDVVL